MDLDLGPHFKKWDELGTRAVLGLSAAWIITGKPLPGVLRVGVAVIGGRELYRVIRSMREGVEPPRAVIPSASGGDRPGFVEGEFHRVHHHSLHHCGCHQ